MRAANPQARPPLVDWPIRRIEPSRFMWLGMTRCARPGTSL